MHAVLADTGPLYAATDTSDGRHRDAQQELERLRADEREVLVAWPVVCEAHSLLLRRLGRQPARRFLEELRRESGILNPTWEDHAEACELLAARPDQPITLFDAVTAVLATRARLPVWTYDHDFDVMGVEVWR